MQPGLRTDTMQASTKQHRETAMKKAILTASLLALGLGAASSATAAGFDYSFVEGGFGELDHGDAFFLNGSYDIDRAWALTGTLLSGNVDPDFDVLGLEVGAQYHQPLKANLSFETGLKILHIKVDGNVGPFSASDDDTGFVANAGLRFQVQPRLQLEGDVKYLSNDLIDDGLGLQGAVRYYLDPKLSIAGGLAIDTELDGLFASVRYDL